MSYKLFSATHRCPPCKALVASLDKNFPEWKNHIEYINADDMTDEQLEVAQKLRVVSLPSFANDDIILYRGFSPNMIEEIKELCLIKE
jgi:thiol-disulfide isomerase/thioredoxin